MSEATYPSADAPLIDACKSGRSLWMGIAVLTAAVLIPFGPIAFGSFSCWDDEDTISLSPGLNPPTVANLVDRWTRPHLHIYVPLTHTVWHVLALVSPKAPAGAIGNFSPVLFKLASIGAHLATSVLVLLLLRRVVGRGWPAVVGALVFAVHPVQVEAVGWTSGLKDVLFGLFAAASLLAYIGTDVDRLRPRGRNVLIALVAMILAGLSKPTAMVIPAMMLAADLLWLRRPIGQSIARLIPFAFGGVVFAVFALRFQPFQSSEVQVALAARPIVAVDSLAFYLGKLLWPLRLAYDYGRTPGVAVAAAREMPWWFAIKLLVVIGIGVGALVFRRRYPLVLLGLALALLPVAPVLGLTYFDFAHYSTVADHYLYLSMAGIGLVVATILSGMRLGRGTSAAITVVIIAWIGLSFRQSMTWLSASTVTEQTLRVNEKSFSSWSNLGVAKLREGDLPAAEACVTRALEMSPREPQSLFLMGNVLEEQGKNEQAADYFRGAMRLSPYTASYPYHLAVVLARAEHIPEAIEALERVVTLDPKNDAATEKLRQLRAFYRQQLSTQPTSAPAGR